MSCVVDLHLVPGAWLIGLHGTDQQPLQPKPTPAKVHGASSIHWWLFPSLQNGSNMFCLLLYKSQAYAHPPIQLCH
jgi:hypothetical protein